MVKILFQRQQKQHFFCANPIQFLGWLVLLASNFLLISCSYYWVPNKFDESSLVYSADLRAIQSIYLNEVRARELFEITPIITEAFSSEKHFKILASFPQDSPKEILSSIGVFSYSIVEARYSEVDVSEDASNHATKTTTLIERDLPKTNLQHKTILFSNAVVKIRYILTNAYSKEVLYDSIEETSFQQYYLADELPNRPTAEEELDRLVRLNADRVANKLNWKKEPNTIVLEPGTNTSLLREYFPLSFGNEVMVKAIRFAQGEMWNKSLVTFLKVVYEPLGDESDAEYLENRASALYNMGQVYFINRDWGNAAQLYAMANLTRKKLHYAQKWSDAIRLLRDAQYAEFLSYHNLIYFSTEQYLPKPDKSYLFPSQNALLNKSYLYPAWPKLPNSE